MGKRMFVAIMCLIATPLAGLVTVAVRWFFGPLNTESWVYAAAASVFAFGATIWWGSRLWDGKEEIRRRSAEELNADPGSDRLEAAGASQSQPVPYFSAGFSGQPASAPYTAFAVGAERVGLEGPAMPPWQQQPPGVPPRHGSVRRRTATVIGVAVAAALALALGGLGLRTAAEYFLTHLPVEAVQSSESLEPSNCVVSPVEKNIYDCHDLGFSARFPAEPFYTVTEDYEPGGSNDFHDVSVDVGGENYRVTASWRTGGRCCRAWLDDIVARPLSEDLTFREREAQNILIDGYHALEAELILQPPSHKAGEVNYIALVATDTREYQIYAYGVDREQWKKFLSSVTLTEHGGFDEQAGF